MSKELDNLVKAQLLKSEPYAETEFNGLVTQAKSKLADVQRGKLSNESRFDLAYNAAHSFALAALRRKGYRPENKRFIVFQALPHTLGFDAADARVLSKCHDMRNLAEYAGQSEIDQKLLAELIAITVKLDAAVTRLT
jgi:hypothetical protein